jgi:flagellar basal body rod protein FlgG
MINAINSLLSGLQAEQTRVDVSANNVANINTPGFQAQRTDQVSNSIGGTTVVSTTTNFQQGALARTDVPTDLALQGSGFFQIQDGAGNTSYTRAGNFVQDANGYLRTPSGGYLVGSGGKVQIPGNAVSFNIGQDGSVNVTDSSGNNSVVNQVNVATFRNPNGLASSGDNLFKQTAASGTPQVSTAGQSGAGTIASGAVELSNTDYTTEAVNQMVSSAAFKADVAAMKTVDEMLNTLFQMKKT